jgi:hypothetical protein
MRVTKTQTAETVAIGVTHSISPGMVAGVVGLIRGPVASVSPGPQAGIPESSV